MRYLLLLVVIAALPCACGHIGQTSRPAPPPPRAEPAVLPRPERPAEEDVAYYRKNASVWAGKDLSAAQAIDFSRFRRGSMLISHSSDPPALRGLKAALKSDDEAQTLKAAQAVLAEDAAFIMAHIVLSNVQKKAGHTNASQMHDIFVKGLLDSIVAHGDGRGFRTAFRVYFVREEYDLMRVIGLKVDGQSLRHEQDQDFDILHVVNDKGKARDIYFEISELFAEEGKRFNLPAPRTAAP